MNKIIIAVIGVLIVIGSVYAYSYTQKEVTRAEQQKMEEDKMTMEKKALVEKEQMETENTLEIDGEVMTPTVVETGMVEKVGTMMAAGSYEAYSADKLARAETGDVILFFHASWCPSCRGLNASIEDNLKSIPEGVSILKLDYDTETELKKKYGVTYQHTLVQVDKDGNMITKWSGGGSLDALLSHVQ